MESLKGLIEFMKSINTNGKWDGLTIENITLKDCLELEKDINNCIDNGLEVTNKIEKYITCLWLIKNDLLTLPTQNEKLNYFH
jgi:hypothetical protein